MWWGRYCPRRVLQPLAAHPTTPRYQLGVSQFQSLLLHIQPYSQNCPHERPSHLRRDRKGWVPEQGQQSYPAIEHQQTRQHPSTERPPLGTPADVKHPHDVSYEDREESYRDDDPRCKLGKACLKHVCQHFRSTLATCLRYAIMSLTSSGMASSS